MSQAFAACCVARRWGSEEEGWKGWATYRLKAQPAARRLRLASWKALKLKHPSIPSEGYTTRPPSNPTNLLGIGIVVWVIQLAKAAGMARARRRWPRRWARLGSGMLLPLQFAGKALVQQKARQSVCCC